MSDPGRVGSGGQILQWLNLPDDGQINQAVGKLFDALGLDVPPADGSVTGGAGSQATPQLDTPKVSVEDMVLLLAALQSKVADNRTKSSVSQIKANSNLQLGKDKERIANLEKSLKKMAKAKKSGTIGKVFGWIGAVAGVIAGAALIATGVGAAAGGFLLASAVVGIVNMTLQSIPQVAHWMANTTAGKAVMWSLFAVQLALAVCSLGAGWAATSETVASKLPSVAAWASKASSLATEVGTTANNVWQVVKVVSLIITGASMVGQGGSTIAAGVYTNDAKDATSDADKDAAMLAKLQGFLQDEEKRLKALLDEAQQGVTVAMQILTGVATNKQEVLQHFKPTV